VEVVAEACRDARVRRESVALAEIWPVVPHGVKLSLGSAEGIDLARARDLGKLARELRAPVVSEHVSFVRAGSREIGHLTELPMTRAAVQVVARNVAALRRELPDVPFLLENVARGFVWSEASHEMSEGDFYGEIVRATGCPLLLDVGNLYANARNAGQDPGALLASFPVEQVAMVHVAGGVTEHGFYFDTHAHPVPDEVFALVAAVRRTVPRVPIMIERDAGFEGWEGVLGEIARLRAGSTPEPFAFPGLASPCEPRSELGGAGGAAVVEPLEARQRELAEALTTSGPVGAAAGGGGVEEAIVRARGVLERKRADDALPLLSELGSRVAPTEALALGRIAETPRLPSMTAVADAMRIAEAAREVPALARAAVRDRAVLHARFSGGPEGPRPRSLPYVRRDDLGGGKAVWAVKGFGAGAAVRVIER